MSCNEYDTNQGDLLYEFNAEEIKDLPELEVTLDEYFDARAWEILEEIEDDPDVEYA